MRSEISDRTPDVSLVVIAFNERDRAAECVRAILDQQTKASFDLTFVDDGSTDGTSTVAITAANGDQRFRLVRLPENRGRGAARAAGVAAATGRAIGFVDSDITLPPDWLARCLATLQGNAAVGGIPVPDGDIGVLTRVTGARPRIVPGRNPVTGSNALFDGGVLRRIGFEPRDRVGEDTRLTARLMREGYRLQRVPGLIVRHAESRSYSQGLRWRFENGLDASTLPRELGILRSADFVWIGWLAAWIVSLVGAVVASPWWLLLGVVATVAAAAAHVVSRFHPSPISPFLFAWVADVPLMTAYLIGRTVGIPRLLRRRP